MKQDAKTALYVICATAVVALFFYCLRPYLLQNPPNTVALLIVANTAALLMYCVVFGPLWIMQMHTDARGRARRILRQSFWAAISGTVIGLVAPGVPPITPAAFACFALALLLLRNVAIYAPYRGQRTVNG